jgi:hypothetical protein
MKLVTEFNIKNCIVVKDDFIDYNKPLNEQIDDLWEDMFQITSIDGKYVLDLGWYEDDNSGSFICKIIYSYDWESPYYEVDIIDYKDFKIEFEKALEIFYKLII